MIETISIGTLISLAKGAADFLSWKEEAKIVDGEWLEKSGLKIQLEQEGYKLAWVSPNQIETRKLDGYEVIYEADKLKRLRQRIEWWSRTGADYLVLVGKKESSK